jgi:hypothetical protein
MFLMLVCRICSKIILFDKCCAYYSLNRILKEINMKEEQTGLKNKAKKTNWADYLLSQASAGL